jgi:dTMP kinase
MSDPARFITFEGGEGAGKSTQVRRLAETLKASGISAVATREPGGSPGAESIRKLLVGGDTNKWNPETETLLLFAARADHVARTIRPALDAGKWVICDRFTDSTYAYQGAGRGVDFSFIQSLENLVLGGFHPDLTFILDVEPEAGLSRTSGRHATQQISLPSFDAAKARRKEARFEGFGKAFHETLRTAFRNIAARSPGRCVLLDASESEDAVAATVWRAVSERFGI